jgi:hypothetical protein
MTEKYEIRIGDALKEAWTIFSKAPEIFVTIIFGILAAFFVLTHLPLVGPLFGLLVGTLGPAAFYAAAEEGRRNGKISFESLKSLVPIAPQLLMLFVVKGILIGVGLMLFVLPGIYLAVIFVFAELFVVLEGKNFLDALTSSKELATQSPLSVLGLCIFLSLLAGSGALLIGLGLLVTVPVAVLTLYCVFRHITLRVVS